MGIRHNLYLGLELTKALDAIVAQEGGNKSKLVNDVMLDWLANRATRNLASQLQPRLDRMSKEMRRDQAKCRRDVGVVLEALMLFVRYVLTVTASDAEHDQAALRRGSERYDRFISQLGRQIAAGGTRPLSDEHDEEASS